MGIDGLEFHKTYHQNLGTFQEACLFKIFFLLKFCPPPLLKSHFKNTIGNPFSYFREWRYHLVMQKIVGGRTLYKNLTELA